ncbi:MAG TPA: DHA2 family efflux MFS transporter permease subunit [Chloroflexota bacterium]|jgi:DHA2 family multidrug resistance protein
MATVAQPLATPRRNPLAGLDYHWQALVVIVLGTFMVVLDTTIVNIALPKVIQVFQSTVDEGDMVLTGYMLALAVVMPATGYLSDRFGAKRVYMITIAGFTIGSALCGLAPNMAGLIAFRVLQGLGGGMVQPLGMSILFQSAPPSQRGSIMGMFGLPLLIAPAIGPTLGGYLVEYVDWRWIFTLNVPIGILAVILGMAILRETPRRAGGRFDWAGFLLAAVGFSAALLALSKAPGDGWTAPHIVLLYLIAAAAIPCWVVVELSQDDPMLDLTVLRDLTYTMSQVTIGVATVALYSALLLLPLFLQNVRGLGAMETGIILLPNALAAAAMMPIAGRLVDKVGARPLAVPGLLLLSGATWMLSGLDPGTSDDVIRNALILRGLATGIMFMPVMTVMMDNIPPPQMPRATALSNVMRQLIAAFGTAIFASLLLDRTRLHEAALAQAVTPTSPAAVHVLSATQLAMQAQGMAQDAAHAVGIYALQEMVMLGATVRAFDDCFRIATFAALVGVLPALLLRRQKKAATGGHREAVVEMG